MIVLLASALAGWLPPETLEEPLVDQRAGARLLLESDGPIEAWEGPLRLTLARGPDGTVVLPAPRTGRQVRIEASKEVTLWREASYLDAPAWDRWERALADWNSGPMPPPPAALGGPMLEWDARRGLVDDDLWLGLALLEMEAVRDRSQTDHPRRPLEGEVWTLEGPGVVVVDHRVVLDEPIQHYRVAVLLEGEPTWEDWVTRENPEEPGVGWARRSTRVVPPGEHEVQVAFDGADVHVEATWRPLRPSFKSRSALRALEAPQGGVGAMEQAHALGGDVVGPALDLLGTEADALARARLIEHLVDPEEALTHFEPTPLLVWALAQRWRKHGDVSAYVFVELAELLPADPELLAELAEALRQPELRPRGEAIRWLAELDSRGRPGNRWTSLPSVCEPTLLPVGPGRSYTRLRAGESARVELQDGQGFPILRLRGHARYRLNGREHRGRGDLSVALAPGVHGVEVLEGELLLPGGLDGEQVYERPLCEGDSQWPLPEPGAPVRLSLTVVGEGIHRVATDDGQTWHVQTTQPITVVELWAGPRASGLSVQGPGFYAASMRRRMDGDAVGLPPASDDPLDDLKAASRALVLLQAQPGPEVATLRLQRAAAYRALDLPGSARREADLVARMHEATPLQRERARALFPAATHAPEQGPVTAEAALAEGGRLPPDPRGVAWEEAAEGLYNPEAVLRRASALYLEEGDLPSAWRTAEASGDEGARRRAAFAGDWEPMLRMEQSQGQRRLTINRTGPEAADGSHAQAREVSLGYPWEPSEVMVVRDGRRDRLEFSGARLGLDLLCRDEDFQRSPQPCVVTLRVDGVEQELTLPDAHSARVDRVLPRGRHAVDIDVEGPGALVVRAEVDGTLFQPQLPMSAHATPLQTTLAGPALVRVRVHQGSATVTVGPHVVQDVTDYVILPVEDTTRVQVDGDDTLVTLSRLRWEPPDPSPEPENWLWIAPAPNSPSARATEHWMAVSAQRSETVLSPPGTSGTLVGRVRAGQDPDYRYGSVEAIWLREAGEGRWLDLSATGRASPDGAPSAGLEFRSTWIPQPWVFSLDAEGWTSGGGGHVQGSGQARYRLDLSPWWRLQPYVGFHAGVWSDPQRVADPMAWDAYDSAHPWGLHLGAHLDWRRYRDARTRLTVRAMTDPGPQLDRVGATVLTDVLAREMLVVRVEGGVNHVFPRTIPYGAGTVRWSPWVDPSRRYVLEGRVRASPVEGVTGYVGLAIEGSDDRGLLDHSRLDRVFLGALDYPVEER